MAPGILVGGARQHETVEKRPSPPTSIAGTGSCPSSLPSQFMTLRNFTSMGLQFPEYGLLALANMLAMITGGIDLSVVSIASLSGASSPASLLSQHATLGMPVGDGDRPGILIALVVSVLCGLLKIGDHRLHQGAGHLIATLGTPSAFSSASRSSSQRVTASAVSAGIPAPSGTPPCWDADAVRHLRRDRTPFGLVLTRTPQGFSMVMYAPVPRPSGSTTRWSSSRPMRSPAGWPPSSSYQGSTPSLPWC